MSNPNPNAGTEVTRRSAAEVASLERRANIEIGRYSLADLMEMAHVMSVAGLVPDGLRGKPADLLIIFMKGSSLGWDPWDAIDAIDSIKGKATIKAHAAVALARQAGHRVSVVEESDESCTVEVVRKDDPNNPVAVTFTTAMAKRAGIRNDKYQTDPQAMLYARAASRCVRRACPEVLLGLAVEGEAVEDDAPKPTLAQVAADREDRKAAEVPRAPDPEPAPVAPDPAPTADEYAALEAEYAETVDPDGGFSFPEEQP